MHEQDSRIAGSTDEDEMEWLFNSGVVKVKAKGKIFLFF